MTFEEYINNPMGKGSALMSHKEMYRQMYTAQWEKLLERENGEITYRLFQDKEDYYVYIKIPSDRYPGFYYDAVVRFFLPSGEKQKSMEITLSNYSVQFYSNDPSFVFTFAHAFKENKLFIKDLESKMSKRALKEKAVMRNPKDEIGYVKSIYFSYLQIKRLNLFNKNRWTGMSEKYSKSVWHALIQHADDKIQNQQNYDKGIEKPKPEKPKKMVKKNISSKSTKINNSPNIQNFGHFKKTNFNQISPIVSTNKGRMSKNK